MSALPLQKQETEIENDKSLQDVTDDTIMRNDDDDEEEEEDENESYIYEDSDMDEDDNDGGSLCPSVESMNNNDNDMIEPSVGYSTDSWSMLSSKNNTVAESWNLVSHTPNQQPTNQQQQISLENLELLVQQTLNIQDDLTASDLASIYSSVFTTKATVCLKCTFPNIKGSKSCQNCHTPLLVNPFPDIQSLLSASALRHHMSPQMTDHVSKLTKIIEESGADEEEEDDKPNHNNRSMTNSMVHAQTAFGFCEGVMNKLIFNLNPSYVSQLESAREKLFELARSFSMKQEQLKAKGNQWKAEVFYYYFERGSNMKNYSQQLDGVLHEWRVQEKSPPYIRVAKFAELSKTQPQSMGEDDDDVEVFLVAAVPFQPTHDSTTGISLSSSKRCLPLISFPWSLTDDLMRMTMLESDATKLVDDVFNAAKSEAQEGIDEDVDAALMEYAIHEDAKQRKIQDALTCIEALLPNAPDDFVALKDLQELLPDVFQFNLKHASEANRGIKISNGRVIQLSLVGQGLTKLPDSIQNLTCLNYLNLEKNKFSVYPTVIRCFEERAVVRLSGNPLPFRERLQCPLELQAMLDLEAMIGRSIPILVEENVEDKTLGAVISGKTVTHLMLSNRELDTVPASIVNLKHLRLLDLDYNSFSVLPDALKKLDGRLINNQGLKTMVSLHGNPLSIGTLIRCPEELQAVLDLEKMIGKKIPLRNRKENTLTLGMKAAYGHVECLSLCNQGLTSLPDSFVNLSRLKSLDLRKNRFTKYPPQVRTLREKGYLYCKVGF